MKTNNTRIVPNEIKSYLAKKNKKGDGDYYRYLEDFFKTLFICLYCLFNTQ